MAYIVVAPENASRQQVKSLKVLIPRLRELGIRMVVAVPRDPAAAWLAAKLHVPLEQWTALKPFNWGKARDRKLPDNPIVPVPGGDSQASYAKRVRASREKLGHTPDALYVSTGAHWRAVLESDLAEGRVYRV